MEIIIDSIVREVEGVVYYDGDDGTSRLEKEKGYLVHFTVIINQQELLGSYSIKNKDKTINEIRGLIMDHLLSGMEKYK